MLEEPGKPEIPNSGKRQNKNQEALVRIDRSLFFVKRDVSAGTRSEALCDVGGCRFPRIRSLRMQVPADPVPENAGSRQRRYVRWVVVLGGISVESSVSKRLRMSTAMLITVMKTISTLGLAYPDGKS